MRWWPISGKWQLVGYKPLRFGNLGENFASGAILFDVKAGICILDIKYLFRSCKFV